MTTFFSEEAMEFTPFSPSKLSTLKTCGLKTHYQYVEKLKEKDIPEKLRVTVDMSAAQFGTAMHRLSELVAEGVLLEKALPQVQREENLEADLVEEVTAHQHAVTNFSNRLDRFKEAHNLTQELREVELCVDEKLEPSDYWGKNTCLRGKADIILLSADGSVAVILDLKTSKSASLKYAQDQLEFYTTLVFALFPKVQTVRNGLYFLRLAKMMWVPNVSTRDNFPMDENNPTLIKIQQHSSSYFSAEEPEIHKNPLCNWCIYKGMCREEIKTRKSK